MTVTGQLKKALKSVCSEVARDKYEGKKIPTLSIM